MTQQANTPLYDVLIVGAGISGIGLGIRLRETGFDNFVILEKAADLGGTWRDNTYPGCACDVPSALYSYSFAQKPDWSRAFAGQAEIAAKPRTRLCQRHLVTAFGGNAGGFQTGDAATDHQHLLWCR